MSRYVPNETACPVPVELLARLLRSNNEQMAQHVDALPSSQRAALAAFCFSRSHLRSLSFKVAALCDTASLRAMTGANCEILIEHVQNSATFDEGPKILSRRGVALGRFVA